MRSLSTWQPRRSLAAMLTVAVLSLLPAQAQYTLNKLTNKSGGTVAAARVVVADVSNASAFTTTATDDANRVLGVTTASVNNNAVGQVALFGMTEVYCDGAVALGDYLVTSSASAGYAESNGSDPNAAFAIAVEAGSNTNINCVVLGPTPTISGTSGSFSSITNTGVYTGSGAITNTINDAGTNDVVTVASLFHTSSGTPAAGLGAKLRLGAEDSAGNSEVAGEIHGYLTTVTNASEQGALLVKLMNAGTLQDALSVTAGSNTTSLVAAQTTLNLFNTVATTVNAFGAATAIAIGAANSQGQFGAASGSNTPKWSVGLGNMRQLSSTQYAISGGTTQFTALLNEHAAAATATLQFDFLSGTPTSQIVQIFRNTPASAGVVTFAVYSPNTNTQNFSVNAKTGDTTMAGALTVNGSGSVFGDASTDTFTFTGRMLVRSVTDAGPMTATPGTQREIVFNTSDNKWYGCTVTHGTAARIYACICDR